MRILVAAADPRARLRLFGYLSKRVDVEVTGQCATAEAALRAIRRNAPQAIFLEVRMHGWSGFELLRKLSPEQIPRTIFVTDYDRYTLNLFDIHGLDYLLKPIQEERIAELLTHGNGAAAQTTARLDCRLLELLDDGSARRSKGYERHLSVRAGQRITIVPVEEVDWIKADHDYVLLHVGKNRHLMRSTLDGVEARLDPDHFIRIHRSAIVQANRILELIVIENREFVVRLSSGTELRASRTYCDRLQGWL